MKIMNCITEYLSAITDIPVIAESLGFPTEDFIAESDLKWVILSHIRDFVMKMGKDFVLVTGQYPVLQEKGGVQDE